MIHSFGTVYDGARPESPLTSFGGVLYGTTPAGSKYDHGTLFNITTSGRERVLYSFNDDGRSPNGPLVVLDSALYGETAFGGRRKIATLSDGCGTVFTSDQSGNVTLLYEFQGNFSDGQYPNGGLTWWNGALYGTTVEGGAYNSGTAFSLTSSSTETVLHAFGKSPDGGYPYAALTPLGNAFYGTTRSGGANGMEPYLN